MASPPSLPSISSPPQTVSAKRIAQLPLPSPRPPPSFKPGVLNLSSPSDSTPNSPRSPSGSLLSAPSMHMHAIEREHTPLSPPSLSSALQPPYSSTTHAGGIQPSASFFRPFHPSQQAYPRPPSDISATSSAFPILSPEPGDVPLTSLSKRPSSSFDDHVQSGSNTVRGPVAEDRSQHVLMRNERRREPLLPLGGHAGSLSNAMPSNATGSRPTPSSGQAGRMRDNFEWVFKRGRSFDSKSTSQGQNTSTLRGLEGKNLDEERTYKNLGHYGQSSKLGGSRQSLSPPLDPLGFVTPPYVHDPPLSVVPVRDVFTGKLLRNYQQHPSRNRFFFSGRALTGGDSPWAFVASSLLVLGISGAWFGTTCLWWWLNESPAVAIVGAYLCLVTISSMLVTATRDPGILPRNLDPDPPYPAASPSDGDLRVPMPRDLKVRSDVVRVKYCPTCKTYRPPRSSHCKMCDNCVDGCDHHCQWVNNCIGRRNYTVFFVFLTSATITLLLVICTSALHLYLLTRREAISFRHALGTAPGSAVVFCLSIAVLWPLATLLTYHMRLLLLNITTIEQIRNQAHKTLVPGPPPPNPFTHGSWGRNLVEVLCRPVGFSYLDGHGIATEDQRELNPGVIMQERKTETR